jgi:hypothetical protein
MDSPQFSHG